MFGTGGAMNLNALWGEGKNRRARYARHDPPFLLFFHSDAERLSAPRTPSFFPRQLFAPVIPTLVCPIIRLSPQDRGKSKAINLSGTQAHARREPHMVLPSTRGCRSSFSETSSLRVCRVTFLLNTRVRILLFITATADYFPPLYLPESLDNSGIEKERFPRELPIRKVIHHPRVGRQSRAFVFIFRIRDCRTRLTNFIPFGLHSGLLSLSVPFFASLFGLERVRRRGDLFDVYARQRMSARESPVRNSTVRFAQSSEFGMSWTCNQFVSCRSFFPLSLSTSKRNGFAVISRYEKLAKMNKWSANTATLYVFYI